MHSSRNHCKKKKKAQSGNHHPHNNNNPPPLPPKDPNQSLVGKTAVSALYEWSNKRQREPTLMLHQSEEHQEQEFECVVYVSAEPKSNNNNNLRKSSSNNDRCCLPVEWQEWGRARASSKHSAKQEAARRAMMALLPGIVFRADTVVAVPPHPSAKQQQQQQGNSSNSMMDELGPHLAKQLAIGHDTTTTTTTQNKSTAAANANNNKRHLKPKRTYVGYPADTSTTTSEEEDASAYYSSRGASVCSQLLYTIIQMDRDRVDFPTFSFQPGPIESASAASGSWNNSSGGDRPTKRTVGPFTCIGRLKVGRLKKMSLGMARQEDTTSSTATATNTNADDGVKPQQEPQPNEEQVLEAQVVGGTKREARHMAAAKLLAMLFPECENMAAVKATAEAMRDQYAASKRERHEISLRLFRLFRQQCSGDDSDNSNQDCSSALLNREQRPNELPSDDWVFAKALSTDPSLPAPIMDSLNDLLGHPKELTGRARERAAEEELVSSVSAVALSDDKKRLSASVARQPQGINRQKQLDSLVESALQNLNDRDEEGRSLPEELTENDVGRTMLRRADPEDMACIKKFFSAAATEIRRTRLSRSRSFDSSSPKLVSAGSLDAPTSHVPFLSESLSGLSDDLSSTNTNNNGQSDKDSSDISSRLWSASSSSIVLLLCRAIAPHEDPLGCAILTMRFSMKFGRTLCLAPGQLANLPHLPRERFIECLQAFSKCMGCHFQVVESSSAMTTIEPQRIFLSTSYLVSIVESHVAATAADEKPCAVDSGASSTRSKRNNVLEDHHHYPSHQQQQLQSVKEEENEEDETSSVEKRNASKRSRFA